MILLSGPGDASSASRSPTQLMRWSNDHCVMAVMRRAKRILLSVAVLLVGALGGYDYFRDGFAFRVVERGLVTSTGVGEAMDLSHIQAGCGLTHKNWRILPVV